MLSALVTAVGVAASASAATLPGAVLDGGTPTPGKNIKARPHQIVYTGDGSGFLAGPGTAGRRPRPGKLKWSSWTGTAALGTGDDWLNNCTPDCADGSFSQHAANIKLYRPRTVLHVLVFTRMTVHYLHGTNPFTHRASEALTLTGRGGVLGWNIPS
jgi:hypothetical protein